MKIKTNRTPTDIQKTAKFYNSFLTMQVVAPNEFAYRNILRNICPGESYNMTPDPHGIVSQHVQQYKDGAPVLDITVSYYKEGAAQITSEGNKFVMGPIPYDQDDPATWQQAAETFNQEQDRLLNQRKTGHTILVEAMHPEVDFNGKVVKMRGISTDGEVVELGAAHFKSGD